MEIKDQALKFLAHQNKSCFQMKEHLTKKGFGEEEISSTIEYLIDFNYLNDEEYARDFLDYQMKKRRGIYRISQELIQKGLSQENIDQGIFLYEDMMGESLSEIELKNANLEAENFIEFTKIDDKTLDKLGRRLSYLGYDINMIYDIVDIYRMKMDE